MTVTSSCSHESQVRRPEQQTSEGQGQSSRRALPAEELFWNRYSPHHEFPLSTATSIALHVLALILLIVAGWLVASMIEKSKLEVSTLEAFAGGGGNRHGQDNGPGDRPPASLPENVDERG